MHDRLRALHVFPVYPGEQTNGSSVFQRRLTIELQRLGVSVSTVTTRTRSPRVYGAAGVAWPAEGPARELVDGMTVCRHRSLYANPLGIAASLAVARSWPTEDRSSLTRPGWLDALVAAGLGPVAPGLLARVRREARHYDVILVGHAPFPLMRQVQLAARRSRTPVIVLPFVHDDDPNHRAGGLIRAYRDASSVFVLSPYTAEVLQRWAPGSRPVVIGAGSTVPRANAAEALAFRGRHGLDDARIVLYVGRKEAGKRYDLAVEAVNGLGDDVVLVMIGQDIDGVPVRSSRVRQLGRLPQRELAAAYAACVVLVVPSEHESFGMVVLDAWLHGKPVVTNRASGPLASLVEDGVDGRLFLDAEHLRRCLRAILDDPADGDRMGAAGRRKLEQDFTWAAVAEKVLATYETAARTRPVRPRPTRRPRRGWTRPR